MTTIWYPIYFGLRIVFVLCIYGFLVYILWHIYQEMRQHFRLPNHTRSSTRLRVTTVPENTDLSVGTGYPLSHGCTVGRDNGNDIVLPSDYVSRNQARFEQNGNNWLLEDLSRKGTTLVNGSELTGGKRVLKNGDSIEFAGIEFRFDSD